MAKNQQNIVSSEIASKSHEKPGISSKITFITFAQYCIDAIGRLEAACLTQDKCYNHPSFNTVSKRNIPNSFHFRNIDKEVLRALQSINSHKVTGFDLIPPRVLKLVSEEIATPLTAIFNQVIKESVLPKEWKKRKWVPVYKKETITM